MVPGAQKAGVAVIGARKLGQLPHDLLAAGRGLQQSGDLLRIVRKTLA